jgi:hypothetical protein
MYAVNAVLTRVTGGYVSVRPLPMFYLDPDVQGITSEAGAEVIAREIVAPFHRPEETVQVTIVNLDPPPRTQHVTLVRTTEKRPA